MNLSPSSRNVRRIAREYGMMESDVREMLAIESGRSKGDVVFADELPTRLGMWARTVVFLKGLFSTSFWTRRRSGEERPGDPLAAERAANLFNSLQRDPAARS